MKLIHKFREWCGTEDVDGNVKTDFRYDNRGDMHIFASLGTVVAVVFIIVALAFGICDKCTCGLCSNCATGCNSCLDSCYCGTMNK